MPQEPIVIDEASESDDPSGGTPVFEAHSVYDLAVRASLTPDAVEATVLAWNGLVTSGATSDAFTGRSLARARPIDRSPFYAIQFLPLVRKNLGGVRTDLRTRVLRSDGTPIAGLYAAGELCGFAGGHLSGEKAQEGIMIGASIFSGRVAGAWAAHRTGGPRPTQLDAEYGPATSAQV